MIAAVYNISDHTRGDTFDGIVFKIYSRVDGVKTAVDLTDSTVKIQFRKENTDALVKTVTDGDGITITDAENGVIRVHSFIVTFAPGLYLYDVQITFPSGDVKTYIKGSFNILNDSTR